MIDKEIRIVAIIEARMGSTRLPEKTLADVNGKTLLERVIDRITPAATVNEIVVATSLLSEDDVIAQLCSSRGQAVFRGSAEDVLDRVWKAADLFNADIIVQCGADCPFYDPDLIDTLVNVIKLGGYAYAANDMKLTFPEGVDAHVITREALRLSAAEAKDRAEREDTPRFIWNDPERFPIFNLQAVPGSVLNRPDIRLTVDYEEDLELTRKLYELTDKMPHMPSTAELIRILDERPELCEINRNCEQRSAAYVDILDN